MSHASSPALLVRHGLRILGYAEEARLATRWGLQRADVAEHLLDLQAMGEALRSQFNDTAGWALTERGRIADERALAAELDHVGARDLVAGVHQQFVPLNARCQQAVTRWQVRPMRGDPLAANDHSDYGWDLRVLEDLAAVGAGMRPLCEQLTAVLARFAGYDTRYAEALRRARSGAGRWVDGVGIDSCHVVWMQLHEDLLATLGLGRDGSN